MQDDAEHLPLWLFHAWDEANNALKDPDALLDRQLQFVEALAEYLAVSFVATLLADPSLADDEAAKKIAAAARHLWNKASAFGDWVALVRAGMGAGRRLTQAVCGTPAEPIFAPGTAAFTLAAAGTNPTLGEARLTVVFDRMVQLRNGRAHGRHSGPPSTELAPQLKQAIDEVTQAIPALRSRPLCHLEQVTVGKSGLTVHFRRLSGDGRRAQRQQTLAITQPAQWKSGALVLWDGESASSADVPEWLARYDSEAHHLRFCQGKGKRPGTLLFHSRQRNVQPVEDAALTGALTEALDVLARPARSMVDHDGIGSEITYVATYRNARASDGLVTKREQKLLESLGNTLGLSSARQAELQRFADREDGWPTRPSHRPSYMGLIGVALVLAVTVVGSAWGFGLFPTPVMFDVFGTQVEIPSPSGLFGVSAPDGTPAEPTTAEPTEPRTECIPQTPNSEPMQAPVREEVQAAATYVPALVPEPETAAPTEPAEVDAAKLAVPAEVDAAESADREEEDDKRDSSDAASGP